MLIHRQQQPLIPSQQLDGCSLGVGILACVQPARMLEARHYPIMSIMSIDIIINFHEFSDLHF
jgi:hypothetical protein